MEILYHHRTQAEDAQGIHIYEMIRAFRNLGHKVKIASLIQLKEKTGEKVVGKKWKWIIPLTPNWLYELMALFYNLYGYKRLGQMIKINRPAFIYERYSLNTFCGIWASRRYKIPIILEVNAPLYQEQSELGKLVFKKFARFSEKWICSNSTWTIAVSNALKRTLVDQGVSPEKIVVMPNGIDPNKINLSVSGDEVRQKFGLHGHTVLGFVGWFRNWHGLEKLLRLFHENCLVESKAKLLLVGDGPAFNDLYDYAKNSGLLNSIIFTGPISHQEIPNYIAAMDIAIQPSATRYACPMKLLEYMGMGKCILAIDQPNIRELLTDGDTGILFEDSSSLISKLKKLIENPDRRREIGQNAYNSIIERKLLWESNAKKVISKLGNSAEIL
jgi:glycosyltransferase involved in cell wall biosynthesis